MTQTQEIFETETTDGITTSDMPKVVLFNDEIHTFDEVITQVMKANAAVGVSMSSGQAETIANEVHTKGKSIAYGGEMEKCIIVSSILEQIALHTAIEV